VAAEQARHLILRTSGVYGWTGTNFMRRMLELARERDDLRVVHDQLVSPTPASALAAATVEALRRLGSEPEDAALGIYHLTSAGAVSWFDFARAILARDPRRGEQRCRVVTPISSTELDTPARRPQNGLLDNTRFVARFGFGVDDWETELDRVFATRSMAD
jgi:dTDP-4-dehydrorhamnose reductase